MAWVSHLENEDVDPMVPREMQKDLQRLEKITDRFSKIGSGAKLVEEDFVFTIDQSGSMSDRCSDGRTKMQHIIHTLKNMILYFHDNRIINLHITVFAFDDNFATVIERKQICATNLQEILTKVDGIQPKGGTNIELALKETGKYITRVRAENPLHNINHIFMTDGEATIGNKNADILKGLVDPSIENAFIGFGSNHDSTLLTHISNHKNSSYHFIDALEKAGLVYGEILHGILYKYLK
jgi:Mg-chelatase subunit ChlD